MCTFICGLRTFPSSLNICPPLPPLHMSGVLRTKASHSGHSWSSESVGKVQGVAKRCRLSLLTNIAQPSYNESKCGGGGGVAGYQPMSAAAHIT